MISQLFACVLFGKSYDHQKAQYGKNAEMRDFIKTEKISGVGHLLARHQDEYKYDQGPEQGKKTITYEHLAGDPMDLSKICIDRPSEAFEGHWFLTN